MYKRQDQKDRLSISRSEASYQDVIINAEEEKAHAYEAYTKAVSEYQNYINTHKKSVDTKTADTDGNSGDAQTSELADSVYDASVAAELENAIEAQKSAYEAVVREQEKQVRAASDAVDVYKRQGEAIEWRVLDKKGDEVLLLSEYGLDAQPFDTSGKERVLWKDSTIRKWLNNDFYTSAFSEKEKEYIVLSSSEGFEEYNEPAYLTSKKPYGHLERETEDKLFFLSYTELVAYFAEDPYGGYYSDPYSHSEILCYPTEYAKQNLKPLYKSCLLYTSK